MSAYLTADEMSKLIDPKTGAFVGTIAGLRREIIMGRPNLVLYVQEDPRGIIVDRLLYEDLSKALGRSAFADEFFAHEGLQ